MELDELADSLSGWEDEFFWSVSFEPNFIAYLWKSGFLPIACSITSPTRNELFILLPKLHLKRSVIMGPAVGSISRSDRKRIRRLGPLISIDCSLDRVITGIQAQHSNSWLCPELVAAFRKLHDQPCCGVGLHSIELWDQEGNLIAGELGYSFQGYYCSLSGFRTVSGSGKIQLLALSMLLHRHGIHMWDLGMDMDYKQDLGSVGMQRKEFITQFREIRDHPPSNSTALMGCDKIPVENMLNF